MKRGLKISFSLILSVLLLSVALLGVSLANQSAPPVQATAPALRPPNPASGVYSLYDSLTPSDVPTATYNWIDISFSADFSWDLRSPGGGDSPNDASVSYPLGFVFPFYDRYYTQFRLSEKGYLFFDDAEIYVGSGTGQPGVIPNSDTTVGINNFIAPFAADIVGFPGISQVYIRTDSSPRRTIIQYDNMVWCCGQYNPRSFQIILYPTGEIQIQYKKVTNFPGTLDDNQIVRVGLENIDGSAGDVYTQGLFLPDNANTWADGLALRFVPQLDTVTAFFIPDSGEVWDDPGIDISGPAPLALGATQPVTRSFYLTHSLVVSSAVPTSVWNANISYPQNLGVLTAGFTITPTFSFSVPTAVTNVNDLARVTFTAISTDAFPAVTATLVVTYGPAQRDLQLSKTIDPNVPPYTNGAFRYLFTAENLDANNSGRSGIARGLVITDVLASNLVIEGNDCGCVTTATLGSRTLVTMTLGTLGPYGQRNIYLEMRSLIPPPIGSGSLPLGLPVTNTAYFTTTSVEVGPLANNTASYTFYTALAPISDLRINKFYRFNPNSVASGQAVPFRVEFYNAGNTPITDVVVIDTLPPGTTFSSATLINLGPDLMPPGPITPAISGPMSRTLTFDLPVVDNGYWNRSRLDIWVNVPQTVPVGSTLVNSVVISDGVSGDSDSQGIDITSNHVNPFISKEPSYDLNGNVIPPEPGQDYTYWINYENRSTAQSADNVVITDTLPPSVTLVSATAGQYITGPTVIYQPGGTVQLPPGNGTILFPGNYIELVWNGIAPIPPGGSGRIAVIVHIDESVPPGYLVANQALLTYTGTFSPANPDDGTSVVTVETNSLIYGSYKIANKNTASAGEVLRYTLVVSNASPTQTIPFTVSDSLPAGDLSYISHQTPSTGSVSVSGNNLLWTASALAPGQAATLTLRARVAVTAPIGLIVKNTAYITSNAISIMRLSEVEVTGGVFGNSSKTASTPSPRSGSVMTYTLTASNTGSAGSAVTVTDILPAEVSLLPASFVGSGSVNASGNALTWTTFVTAQASTTLTFRVIISDALPDGLPVVNTAVLSATGLNDAVLLASTVNVSNPDFSASSKSVSDLAVPPGGTVVYTIQADNSGSAGGTVVITDTLPASMTLVAGTFNPPGANVVLSPDNRTFTWTVTVNANSNQQLSFEARTAQGLSDGVVITNTAWLSDDIGSAVLALPATFVISSSAVSDFSGSAKLVDYAGSAVVSGDTVTYTLVASNSGVSSSPITITDALPAEVSLVPASFVGNGAVIENGNAFTWTVFVNAMTEQTLSFQALVEPDLGDGVMALNTANLYTDTQSAPLALTASLTISNPVYTAQKSASPTTVGGGDTVTFTLIVSNSGSVSGTVNVSDLLTDALTLLPGSFNPAGDVSVNGNGFNWTPTVESGSQAVLTFQALVGYGLADGASINNAAYLDTPALSGLIPFSASVAFAGPDFTASSKTASVSDVAPGVIFTYTLTVSNTGSDSGTALVSDTLPAYLTLLTGSLSVGAPTATLLTNGLVWSPTVAANAQAELTFRAQAGNVITDGLVITNTGWLTHPSLSGPLALSAAVTNRIPDLGASDKTASAAIVTRNQTFSYTITARNTASGDTTVTVIDSLPAEVDLVSASFSPTVGVVEGANSFTWTVAVAGNSSQALTFRVTANDQAVDGQNITNIATLNHPGLTGVITMVNQVAFAEPDFAPSSKSVASATPASGDIISYTITLSNAGSVPGSVVVTDQLPANLTLDGASFAPSSGVTASGNAFTWTVSVAALTEASLTFQAQVANGLSDGTIITNTAYISNIVSSSVLPVTATLTIVNRESYIYLPLVMK